VDAREARWQLIRRRAGIGYLIALVLVIVFVGVPTDRGSLTLVVILGLGVACLGRGWKAFGRVLLDWVPFTVALVLYDYSRGLAHWINMPLHVSDIAAVDRRIFGLVPTVWLQDHFLDPGQPRWYDAVATLVYTTHFLATPILAGVLWVRNRAVWIKFVRRVFALSLAGLATYILFPAAPPWYAAREGVIAPVIRASSRGWLWLHINHAGNLLQEGQAAANPVAAMPSLHTGFATLITLFMIATLSTRWRWAFLIYPLLMGISLLYLGEHYFIDLVAGVAYALAVHLLCNKWEARRAGVARYTESSDKGPATRRV
jgi:membrane-associated phospholipid phosphatase